MTPTHHMTTFNIPRLETERLLLREFQERDHDAYAAMCADAEVVRYIGDGAPSDRNAAWRQMATFNGHWTLRGCGMWAVERKSDGVLLGRIGLYHPPIVGMCKLSVTSLASAAGIFSSTIAKHPASCNSKASFLNLLASCSSVARTT